ncbi:MAG TPA: tetratricopeptide repeat protein [Anaerolineales bacterium]
MEAAESVCSHELSPGSVLDLLGRLVDKSLVIVEAGSDISETRYRLLDTIRQYALEKLMGTGETQSVRDWHVEYFLQLAEKSEQNYYYFGSRSALWFGRLDRDLDNFRAAMEWSTNNGNAVAALRIAGSLVYFWFAHGLRASEWNDRIQQALSRPEGRERTLARAKALNGIGFMYWADIISFDRRPELEEALSIAQEFGDRWNTATALRNLGLLANIQGNYSEASSFLEQSLEIWRTIGPEGSVARANTTIFLGDVAFNQNDAESARMLYEDAAAVLREAGDMTYLAYTVRRLGQLAWRDGEFKKALAFCKESLKLNLAAGDPRGTVACLAGFAAIATAQGQLERAAVLMAAVESQTVSLGIGLLYIDMMEFDRSFDSLRAKLEGKAFGRAWAKGTSLTMEEAIRLALEGS